MAAARKCDVCGVFYEPYNNHRSTLGFFDDRIKPNGFRWININDEGETKISSEPMDCCETCLGKIEAFLNELKGEE